LIFQTIPNLLEKAIPLLFFAGKKHREEPAGLAVPRSANVHIYGTILASAL
jgi:hypothetical protein